MPHGPKSYLLEKLNNPKYPENLGKLRFPGGGVDRGETLQEAAVRELREELKLQTTTDQLRYLGQDPRADKNYEHYLQLAQHGLKPGLFYGATGGDSTVQLIAGKPGGNRYMGADLRQLIASKTAAAPTSSHKQEKPYSCGPAALKAALEGLGKSVSEQKIRQQAGTDPVDGTDVSGVAQAAHQPGVQPKVRHPMSLAELLGEVDQGHPVVCDIQDHGNPEDFKKDESGHYVVAKDHEDGKIEFHDPYEGRERELPLQEFSARWHDEEPGGRKTERFGVALHKQAEVRPHDTQDEEGNPMQLAQSLDGHDNFEVKPSPIHGHGTFARKSFKAGEPIGHAAIMKGKLANMQEKVCDRTLLGRYINHHDDPNTEIVELRDGHLHVQARQDIPEGAEMTCHYKDAISAQLKAWKKKVSAEGGSHEANLLQGTRPG